MNQVQRNLSHEATGTNFEEAYNRLKAGIDTTGTSDAVRMRFELLESLSQFALGRFLIERGGLNGFWTQYVVSYPARKKDGETLHDLEAYLLNKAPIILATQQRFSIFKEEIQKRLKEGGAYASIPCGLMGDLLDADFSGLTTFTLHGIDLDKESLDQALEKANEKGLQNNCRFTHCDAWSLSEPKVFDLITSNGLNIYEPDDQRTVELYRVFHKQLKPGGVLITSFLTPPPKHKEKSEWVMDHVNYYDAELQKTVFSDVLKVKWQVFRTEAATREHLRQAGFDKIEILYDRAHIFPTVIATKSNDA